MARRRKSYQKPEGPFVLNHGSAQANGLVGWWPGSGAGGKLFDMTGRGNHGTLTNFATPFTATSGWAFGKDGGKGALALDGVDDHVVVPSAEFIQDAITVSCWIYPTALPTLGQILFGLMDKRNNATGSAGWVLELVNLGTQAIWFVAASAAGAIRVNYTLPLNTWSHICGTMISATTVSLYVNGISIGSGTPDTLSPFAKSLYIGSRDGNFVFPGIIEEPRIYDRAASAAEVYDLYDPQTRWELRYVPGRVKYSFGNVSTGIAFDAASNSGYQAASSTPSWSHTCAGSNRFLGVDVSLLSVPGTTVTGITYNGVAMSLIGVKSIISGAGRVECWGLANPASGDHTIVVTLSAVCISASTATSYTNVHQTSPTEAFNSAQATNVGAADATVTITTVADNDWVHAAIATDDASVTAGQTSRNNVTGAGGSGANEDTGPKTPAGGQAMTYTGVGALATWAIAGYGIRPVTATGGALTLTCATGSYTSSGVNPTLKFGRKTAPSVGSYALSGVNPSLKYGRKAVAAIGSYALSGVAASFPRTRILAANVGSYALSGANPSLLQGYAFSLAVGAYSVTGIAPSLIYGTPGVYALSCGLGAYALTGVNPSLKRARIVSPSVGSYALTGVNPGLLRARVIAPSSGSFTVTGVNPALKVGRVLPASVGSYSLTGVAPTLKHGYALSLTTGAYALSGVGLSFRRTYVLMPSVGHYAYNGIAVGLAYSGDITQVTSETVYASGYTWIDMQSSGYTWQEVRTQ